MFLRDSTNNKKHNIPQCNLFVKVSRFARHFEWLRLLKKSVFRTGTSNLSSDCLMDSLIFILAFIFRGFQRSLRKVVATLACNLQQMKFPSLRVSPCVVKPYVPCMILSEVSFVKRWNEPPGFVCGFKSPRKLCNELRYIFQPV